MIRVTKAIPRAGNLLSATSVFAADAAVAAHADAPTQVIASLTMGL